VFRVGFRVFRVGFRVFRVGFRVFRVGFRVFRIGFRVFRVGFRVFRVGFWVFRVGSGCSGWSSGFYRHPRQISWTVKFIAKYKPFVIALRHIIATTLESLLFII
jgi:hypothetical protein